MLKVVNRHGCKKINLKDTTILTQKITKNVVVLLYIHDHNKIFKKRSQRVEKIIYLIKSILIASMLTYRKNYEHLLLFIKIKFDKITMKAPWFRFLPKNALKILLFKLLKIKLYYF